jgi:osmotically-inducible protein OsmY
MQMKSTHPLALIMAAGTLLVTSASMRASDMDSRIESSAANSYVFKTYLKDDSVKIDSKDGVVTLTGTVADASHKSLAQDTARSLPGVKSVDNELQVSGNKPAEHSDEWISMKVRFALLFHRHVSVTGTSVFVKDGIVTLQGEASSVAGKELTAVYAGDVDDVKAVKNEMTIAKAPAAPNATAGDKIDDASITAEVTASLLAQRSTTALKPKASTTDGVVTLTGIDQNDAQKSQVTKFVADLNGVTGVINNMTDDSSITAEVRASLLSHDSTSGQHIKFSTTDGVVTLSGIAKNAAEKSLVTKLVTDINGVTSVTNNMTIQKW